MNKTIYPVMIAFAMLSATAQAGESACNYETMSEQEFSDCIVVEGAGQSWSSYQKEMRELESRIRDEQGGT